LVDLLEEVDIGDDSIPWSGFIKQNLNANYNAKLIELLKEYVNYFALNYHEMFGLSHELVEHGPPINPSFRLNKQAGRLYNPAMYDQIKEENNR
jgi:hypothetical protein